MDGRSLAGLAAELEAGGRPFVLATVTWVRPPSSGQVGSKAVIMADGRTEGWLGGACATPTVVRYALEALQDGKPRSLFLGEGERRPGTEGVTMACDSEGAMEVFIEPYLPAPLLMVVGESPIVKTLDRLARALGWRSQILTEQEQIKKAEEGSYLVVATQGHWDEPALEEALATQAAYIGLVSSPKRAASTLEWLREQGFSEKSLARIHAPAGVDLGPTLHEEIAVSVLAGLVSFKNSKAGVGETQVEFPELSTDPVCGMSVDMGSSRLVRHHQGKAFYFCAAGCRRAFDSDPAAYLPA